MAKVKAKIIKTEKDLEIKQNSNDNIHKMDINTLLQKGYLKKSSDIPIAERFSSGSISLDFGLGGGIPRGKIIIIQGRESVGKTLMALKALAEFQKKYPDEKEAIIDYENAFSFDWAQKLGVDTDKLYICQPETGNEGIDIAKTLLKSGEIGFLMVDSMAQGTPYQEMERSSFDAEVSVGALMWNKYFRVIQSSLNYQANILSKKPASIIMINQIRSKVGLYGGTTVPGGLGQKNAASVIVEFKAEYDGEKLCKELNEIVGLTINYHMLKNKTAPKQHYENTFTIYFKDSPTFGLGGRIDNDQDLIRFGAYFGIINQAGTWYQYQDHKYQGMFNFIANVPEDILQEIKEQVRLKL